MKKLSWDEIEEIMEELASKIKASGFKPDFIVGVTAGGLIPLYYLIKKLGNTSTVLTVTANSYDKDKKKELKISYLPQADLSNKKVLLVDEIAETGDTLEKISQILKKEYKAGELKTATLWVNKDKCKFYPDFFVINNQDEWVVFPWEKDDFPEYFQ